MSLLLVLGYIGIPLVVCIASLPGNATATGFPISIYFDNLSFLVTPLSPYFIVAGIYKTFNLNKEGLILFGNLAVGFGFIGTILGWIIMGQNVPLDKEGLELANFLFKSFAVSMLPSLYGLLTKYLLVKPIIACKENC